MNELIHITNIFFLKKIINNMNFVWLRMIFHKYEPETNITPEKPHFVFKDVISIVMRNDMMFYVPELKTVVYVCPTLGRWMCKDSLIKKK